MEAELEDLWRLKECAPDFRGFSGKRHVLNSLICVSLSTLTDELNGARRSYVYLDVLLGVGVLLFKIIF